MSLKPYLQSWAKSKPESPMPVDDELFASMLELFHQIGVFWKNAPEGVDVSTQLYIFMNNRIELDYGYLENYKITQQVLREFIAEYKDKETAYANFFTDPNGLEDPPKTKLALARQKVSNEFIAFQLSIGGFKAFGAENYPGYINGSYREGHPAPYRTKS